MYRDSGSLARGYSQRGAAALPISVLLLFAATLVLIAVSRTALMEQRISGNEIRTRQAFQAALAGISHAMAYMKGGGIDRNGGADNIADSITPLSLTNGASYSVYYCDPSPSSPPNPYPPIDACESLPPPCQSGFTTVAKFSNPLVLACGWSDDLVAKQAMVVSLSRAATLNDAPDCPVISKGSVHFQGSATITNYFTNLTIWTGDSFGSVGNSGKTFVRNPNVPQPPMTATPPGPPDSCTLTSNYLCLTEQNIHGPDVIDEDLTLKNMSDDNMFKDYFGYDFDTYKYDIATRAVASANVASLAGARGEALVITDAFSDVSLPDGTIGTRDNPVVLIIQGNLAQGGNTTVYGVVYVMGHVDVSGNLTVYGNVSVVGVVAGTGSLDVNFDLFSINNCKNLGKAGLLSGSWRDWF